MRDAMYLLRPGDHPGPAGAILRQWSRAVAQLGKAICDMPADRIAVCLDAVGGNPVDRAAAVLEHVLAAAPRAETAAMILADAGLAKSMGCTHLLPLLALALKPRDLRACGAMTYG